MSSPHTPSSSKIRAATGWPRQVRSSSIQKTRRASGRRSSSSWAETIPLQSDSETVSRLRQGSTGTHSRCSHSLIPATPLARKNESLLEHGATVLALELSRLQSVLEAESRLGNDLLGELLTGTDDERARMRAQILGYDQGRRQRVAIVDYPSSVPQDLVFHAVRRAAQNLGARPLLGSQRDTVITLTEASFSWESLRSGVDAELGRMDCRIGVGGICEGAADVPRSYREAQLALQLMSFGHRRPSVVLFDELGVFEILAETKDPNTIQRFVRKWLGTLLEYDERRSTDLVGTLTSYLEAGGNYAHSARALNVHRNTLRYRLKRIQEISGYDLGDPDVQFNLQLATRAWRTSTALNVLNAGHA